MKIDKIDKNISIAFTRYTSIKMFRDKTELKVFGKNLKSCALDDINEINLEDISGFDILNGYSLFCHYTNRTKEKDEESKVYLLELSKQEKIIALPEEDTIFVNKDTIEVIGNRPYYLFENGKVIELKGEIQVFQK